MKEIEAPVLGQSQLEASIKQTISQSNPEPSPPTKKASRWIQGIIKNCTQYELRLSEQPAYFAHGKYETPPPTTIPPFSTAQFTGVNKFGVWWVAGGNAFTLYLEKDAEIPIALGWTAPLKGAYKSAIVESKDPKVGYDKTVEKGNKVSFTEEFQGGDDDGNGVKVHFKGSCTGEQRPVYTITQIVKPTHNY